MAKDMADDLTADDLLYLENMFRSFGFHGTLKEQAGQRRLFRKVVKLRKMAEKSEEKKDAPQPPQLPYRGPYLVALGPTDKSNEG